MNKLFDYIIKKRMISGYAVFAFFWLIVFGISYLKTASLLYQYGVSFKSIVKLMFLILPISFNNIVSIGSCIGTMIALERFVVDRELIAARSVGFSSFRVGCYFVAPSLFLSCIVFFLEGWICPYSNKAIAKNQEKIAKLGTMSFLRENSFYVSSGTTVFIGSVSNNEFSDLFVFKDFVAQEKGVHAIIKSQKALIAEGEEGLMLKMYNFDMLGIRKSLNDRMIINSTSTMIPIKDLMKIGKNKPRPHLEIKKNSMSKIMEDFRRKKNKRLLRKEINERILKTLLTFSGSAFGVFLMLNVFFRSASYSRKKTLPIGVLSILFIFVCQVLSSLVTFTSWYPICYLFVLTPLFLGFRVYKRI